MLRRVVPPPLAREVPPPPTLLSPRATNCASVAAICNIEDKRARERDRDQGKPASKRTAPPRPIQGQLTTNWKQALAQLTATYPDRITPYL